ncbi:MAG: hypothetical protein MK010_09285, partial [Erythrobacter sp.]|nr:hypothetical protein [Erythrobacter sp.]
MAGSRFASAADPFGGFKVGVQSYSFRNFDLDRAVKGIHDLGLGYAEFYRKHVPLESTPKRIAAVRSLCDGYGVTPIGFGVQRFTKDHEENRKTFEFGKRLGVEYLSADPAP